MKILQFLDKSFCGRAVKDSKESRAGNRGARRDAPIVLFVSAIFSSPPPHPPPLQVPFLSVGGELGWREVVSRGVSALSGEYSVEDVRGEDGFLYRRLVFLDNAGVVQSESRLCATAPGETLVGTSAGLIREV